MSHEEDIDAKLLRLSNATAGIGPRADFSSRVRQRIGREQLGTLYALRAPARRFLPLGVLAAALAMFWAVSVDNQVNEELAASDDMELAW
jgi:hypothetical protein